VGVEFRVGGGNGIVKANEKSQLFHTLPAKVKVFIIRVLSPLNKVPCSVFISYRVAIVYTFKSSLTF
jgi:hypothetical protein